MVCRWHSQNRSTSFLSDIYDPLFMPRCNSSDGILFLRQKDRPTYPRALQIFIGQQEELQPGSMCDFEKAFYQALEDVFGENGNIKGCYFHLSQSIWGRFQEQNLVQTYKENEKLRLKMKMLDAIAFVPTNLVLHYLEVLSDDIPAELEPLYDYFED